MSFSSGATLSVGTLEAQFQLNSSAATASIAGIQSQMTTLRQSFTQNNILNVNTSAAVVRPALDPNRHIPATDAMMQTLICSSQCGGGVACGV